MMMNNHPRNKKNNHYKNNYKKQIWNKVKYKDSSNKILDNHYQMIQYHNIDHNINNNLN